MVPVQSSVNNSRRRIHSGDRCRQSLGLTVVGMLMPSVEALAWPEVEADVPSSSKNRTLRGNIFCA